MLVEILMSVTTLRTTPRRANELFARIADASPTALKTRQRLVGELKQELEEISRLEEQHLLPVLRKRPETKDLGPKLAANLKARRELLAKLESTPPESEDFSRTATELKRAFQQHLRDEKNELLPAIQKVLTEEEASALAEGLEADRAKIEAAARQATQDRRAEAREARERAEGEERAERQAESAARKAAKQAKDATVAANNRLDQGVEKGLHGAGELAQLAATAAKDAMTAVQQSTGRAAKLLEYGAVVREGLQQGTQEWITWAQQGAEARTRGLADLAQCRSPLQFAQLQRRLMKEELDLFFGAAARVADASKASAEKASRL